MHAAGSRPRKHAWFARGIIGVLCATTALLATAENPEAISPLIATQLTQENFDALRLGGPDADSGVGDWVLSNGTLCAAISDPAHESPVAPAGGILIDLGHCGLDDDQWAVLQPMLNLSPSRVIDVTEVKAGTTSAEAWIRTRTTQAGVDLVTTYSLSVAEPTTLRILTRAERFAEGERLFALGSTLLHPSAQTRPFSLQRAAPDRSLGFRFPHSDRHSLRAMYNSLGAADVQILVGAEGYPPISYGIEQRGGNLIPAEGPSARLRPFTATGKHFTSFNTLVVPLWIGAASDAPTILDLARGAFADLPLRARIESEVRIWVGDVADVASVTNQIWSKERRVRGQVSDPRAKIHIERKSGAAVSLVRPNASGAFEINLPIGDYQARAVAPGRREAALRFTVGGLGANHDSDAPIDLEPIQLAKPSAIRILPSPFRGRVLLHDEATGEAIVFGSDMLGVQIGSEAPPSAYEAPFFTFVGSDTDGPDEVSARPASALRKIVPPGRYTLLGVRGPEYAIHRQRIEIRPGQETTVQLPALARTTPSPGFLAADLHVHSGESFDSGLPQTAQIEAFVASGAEILVASEHDRIVDPGPALEETGLAGALVIVNGLEMTSSFEGGDSPHSTGHWNLFPMKPTPRAFRGGVPNLEGRRIRDAIADIRRVDTKPFLQLNHPRAGSLIGEGDLFFNHLGVAGVPFDPTHPLLDTPNSTLLEPSDATGVRDLDYDGVELMNGEDMLRYRRVRADWFSLLLQGEFKVATANSDSHRLGVVVGLPRTYVAAPSDALADFDEREFVATLRRGAAYGSTGPHLDVRLGKQSLGEMFKGTQGILEVTVRAADWVPVSEWRAYVNGELVHRAPIQSGETRQLPLVFQTDSFVTVEVEGRANADYAVALPGFTPFAFSNPIFVDTDGNGRYDAPGLPTILPPTLTRPDTDFMP